MQIISAYEAEQRKKMYGYNGGDMTSPGSTELTSVCYEYSYPDNNCNTSKSGIYAIGKTVSEHHYEQPMVILPSRSPVDSIVKPLISDTSSSSTGGNFRAYYRPLQIGLVRIRVGHRVFQNIPVLNLRIKYREDVLFYVNLASWTLSFLGFLSTFPFQKSCDQLWLEQS